MAQKQLLDSIDFLNGNVRRLGSAVWAITGGVNQTIFTCPADFSAIPLFFILRNPTAGLLAAMGADTQFRIAPSFALGDPVINEDWANFLLGSTNNFQKIDIERHLSNFQLSAGESLSANSTSVGASGKSVTVDVFGYLLAV